MIQCTHRSVIPADLRGGGGEVRYDNIISVQKTGISVKKRAHTVPHLLVTAKTPPTTAHMRTMKCRKEGGRSLTVTMMGDTSYMMSTAARTPPGCEQWVGASVNSGFGASVKNMEQG